MASSQPGTPARLRYRSSPCTAAHGVGVGVELRRCWCWSSASRGWSGGAVLPELASACNQHMGSGSARSQGYRKLPPVQGRCRCSLLTVTPCMRPAPTSPLWLTPVALPGANPAAVTYRRLRPRSSCQSLFDADQRSHCCRAAPGLDLANAGDNGRLGPIPRTTIGSLLVPLPRMKPAITMSLPVLTKARVLMLPSFEAVAWSQIVDFHQAYPVVLFVAFHDRRVGARIQRHENG